jgi:hypothetical protein
VEKHISGEEHKKIVSSIKAKKNFPLKTLYMVVLVIVIILLSFFGGVSYQKHHSSTSKVASTTTNRGGFSRQSGGMGMNGGFSGNSDRVIGSVTAISSSSISVADQRTGSTVTLSITSSTQISDNDQSVSASDIQTGDTVFVTEDSSNTSDADRILVNPSFGGGGGAPNQNSENQSSTGVTN